MNIKNWYYIVITSFLSFSIVSHASTNEEAGHSPSRRVVPAAAPPQAEMKEGEDHGRPDYSDVPCAARNCLHWGCYDKLPDDREISQGRHIGNVCISLFLGGCIGGINRCQRLPVCCIVPATITAGCLLPMQIVTSSVCGTYWLCSSKTDKAKRDLDAAVHFKPAHGSVHAILCSHGFCCVGKDCWYGSE